MQQEGSGYCIGKEEADICRESLKNSSASLSRIQMPFGCVST